MSHTARTIGGRGQVVKVGSGDATEHMNGRAGGRRVGCSLSLPTRRLGNSELVLTTLGLGTAAMGGPDWPDGWGGQDDATSEKAILRAVECGIGWIDTAPVY